MTPEERTTLQTWGRAILGNFIQLTPLIFLYGALAPVALFAVNILWGRAKRQASTRITLGIVILAFILLTLYVIVDTSVNVVLSSVLLQNATLPLYTRRKQLTPMLITLGIPSICCQMLPPIINDALIIWRAWVIFERRRWALIIPMSVWLATLSTSLLFIIKSSSPTGFLAAATSSDIATVAIALSLATNFIATSFIAWTLWKHFVFIHGNLNASDRKSFKIWKVILLLVESGFVYCILQIVTLVFNFVSAVDGTPGMISETVFISAYNVVSALYPALVAVLINNAESPGYSIHQSVLSRVEA